MVKTDYIPLLQSLAPYGWRLMCVLPTPIVKTNRYRTIPQELTYPLLSLNSITLNNITYYSIRTLLILVIVLLSYSFFGLGLTVYLRYTGQMVRDLTNHNYMLIST